MDWASRRKFLIMGLLLLVALIILGFFIYPYITKAPTCFDGKQNGNERGVDCGGACQLVCKDSSRNVVVLWARPFKVTDGVYNAVAYFENQNVNSGIRNIFYEFKMYDENNILVSEPVRGRTFIGPNQRSAIFESGLQTGERVPKTVFFQFLEEPVWEKTDEAYSAPLFVVRNRNIVNSDTRPKLTADIQNISFKDYSNIYVIAILYDEDNNAFAASQTFVDSLAQGKTETVSFTWPLPLEKKPARIEIISRINPFSPGV